MQRNTQYKNMQLFLFIIKMIMAQRQIYFITPLQKPKSRSKSKTNRISTQPSPDISNNNSIIKSHRKFDIIQTDRESVQSHRKRKNHSARNLITEIVDGKYSHRTPILKAKLNPISLVDQIQAKDDTKLIQDLKNPKYNLNFIRMQYNKGNNLPKYAKSKFWKQIQNQQQTFFKKFEQKNYKDCMEIILNFLNYSIDLYLLKQFTQTVYYVAEFYFIFSNYNYAIYFFNIAKICAIRIINYDLLTNSLIGLAKCCSNIYMNQNAIRFLKKALEYSWLTNDKQKQLKIYDLIGIKYYKMGNIQMANYFHKRYGSAGFQSDSSPVKVSIKYKLKQRQKMLVKKKVNEINVLFLIELNIIVKSLQQLRNINQSDKGSIRQAYNKTINNSYKQPYQSQQQISRILKQNQFSQQIPHIFVEQNQKYQNLLKNQKHSIQKDDLQFNRIIVNYQKRYKPKTQQQKDITNPLLYKLDLNRRIQNRLKIKPLQQTWYKKIISKTILNRKFKIDSFKDQILIRKSHKQYIQRYHVKQVYNSFFVDIIYF